MHVVSFLLGCPVFRSKLFSETFNSHPSTLFPSANQEKFSYNYRLTLAYFSHGWTKTNHVTPGGNWPSTANIFCLYLTSPFSLQMFLKTLDEPTSITQLGFFLFEVCCYLLLSFLPCWLLLGANPKSCSSLPRKRLRGGRGVGAAPSTNEKQCLGLGWVLGSRFRTKLFNFIRAFILHGRGLAFSITDVERNKYFIFKKSILFEHFLQSTCVASSSTSNSDTDDSCSWQQTEVSMREKEIYYQNLSSSLPSPGKKEEGAELIALLFNLPSYFDFHSSKTFS